MKKDFTIISLLLIPFLSFALPNMALYEEGELVYEIKNDKILDKGGNLKYIIKDNRLHLPDTLDSSGTISEKDGRLVFDYYFEDTSFIHHEYSMATGFLLRESSYWFGEITTEIITEYD